MNRISKMRKTSANQAGNRTRQEMHRIKRLSTGGLLPAAPCYHHDQLPSTWWLDQIVARGREGFGQKPADSSTTVMAEYFTGF